MPTERRKCLGKDCEYLGGEGLEYTRFHCPFLYGYSCMLGIKESSPCPPEVLLAFPNEYLKQRSEGARREEV